jgi:hypothetical protein
MSFYDPNDEFETFFAPTQISLFGKPFNSLRYVRESMQEAFEPMNPAPPPNELRIPPRRIERTLRKEAYDTKGESIPKIFARIYSFAYEGHYYKLPRPLLFLVSGKGFLTTKSEKQAEYERQMKEKSARSQASVAAGSGGSRTDTANSSTAEGKPNPGQPDKAMDTALPADRPRKEMPDAQRRPEKVDTSSGRLAFDTRVVGLDARDWQFSDDLRVWHVDKKDLAVCLDVEIGNYGEILLDSMIASGGGRGASARGDVVSRGDVTSRGDVVSRGAGSFRGDVIGPHQNR